MLISIMLLLEFLQKSYLFSPLWLEFLLGWHGDWKGVCIICQLSFSKFIRGREGNACGRGLLGIYLTGLQPFSVRSYTFWHCFVLLFSCCKVKTSQLHLGDCFCWEGELKMQGRMQMETFPAHPDTEIGMCSLPPGVRECSAVFRWCFWMKGLGQYKNKEMNALHLM